MNHETNTGTDEAQNFGISIGAEIQRMEGFQIFLVKDAKKIRVRKLGCTAENQCFEFSSNCVQKNYLGYVLFLIGYVRGLSIARPCTL